MVRRQAAPLREQAVEELRQRIVRGELRAGERLKEIALVEQLEVSRTVVREALRQLESERLIRIEPHVGPLVAELTAVQARQLYEVRSALEANAARLAAANHTEAQLSALRESLHAIEAHLSPVEDLLDAKRAFYNALIRASHNTIIGEQLDGVQARISQLRRVTLTQPGRGTQMINELRAVVDAVADRDGDRAYTASVEHVMAAAAIAIGHLNEPPEGNVSTTLFIGLGHMGHPMVKHIAERHPTAVYDISPEKVVAAAEDGRATPVYNLTDIAGIGTVILMLPTSKHVEETLLDAGLLERLDEGALVIDMGSSVPASTQRLASVAAERGIDYVDAPVSGGVSKAVSADLTMLVGGEPTAVERARPYLETFGSTIVVVSGSGSGHAAKAINNLVSATNIAVAAEAVQRGKAVGIAPERMIEVLNSSTGMSQATRVKFVNHILPGTYASNFAYDLMLKDMGIAMEIDVPDTASRLSNAAYQLLIEGRELLGEQADHTEIARLYENLSCVSDEVEIPDEVVAPE